jgi:hypothetical protein
MGAVLPEARACLEGRRGILMVRVVVSTAGKVVAVESTAETAAVDCVEKAIKGAVFPPSPGLIFRWPVAPPIPKKR